MIITPIQELANFSTAPITEGGTFAFVSGPNPSPAAPAWDGTIDFTGFAEGVYTYSYSVGGCALANLVVEHSFSAPRPNDMCAMASTLPVSQPEGFFRLENQSTAIDCPDFSAATASGVPEPWPNGPYNDLWYVATLAQPSTGMTITINIDGELYGVEGILEPRIAFYSDCAGTLLSSANATFGTRFNSLTYTLTSDVSTFLIRVAGTTDGRFDIEIDS